MDDSLYDAEEQGEVLSTWIRDWAHGNKPFVRENEEEASRIIDHIAYNKYAIAKYFTVVYNEEAYTASDHLPIYAELSFVK